MKAFPVVLQSGNNDYGMDLRDYFAAHIIQGLVANSLTCTNDDSVIKATWGLADMMIKQRKESK